MRVERKLMGAPTMWALTWIASQSSWRFWSDFLRMFSSIVCSLQGAMSGAVSSALVLGTSTNNDLNHRPASQAAVGGASGPGSVFPALTMHVCAGSCRSGHARHIIAVLA